MARLILLRYGLLALLTAVPLVAEPTKPWMLPLEERIALRTNADLARERVRSATVTGASGGPTYADIFDGKTHPELFLPHELFEMLIKSAFDDPRAGQIFQNRFTAKIRDLGLPDDFWTQLRSMSHGYIGDMARLSDVRKRPPAENAQLLKLVEENVCSSRARALAETRSAFGQRFDQFLYEAIAVRNFQAVFRLPDPEALRLRERGCK